MDILTLMTTLSTIQGKQRESSAILPTQHVITIHPTPIHNSYSIAPDTPVSQHQHYNLPTRSQPTAIYTMESSMITSTPVISNENIMNHTSTEISINLRNTFEKCLEHIQEQDRASNSHYAGIWTSPCNQHLNVCHTNRANVHTIKCKAQQVLFRNTTSDASLWSCDNHKSTKNQSMNDCLEFVRDANVQHLSLNQTLIDCSACQTHQNKSWSTTKNINYWQCMNFNTSLLINNRTATRYSLALSPCYEFSGFTAAEIKDMCVSFINDSLNVGIQLNTVLIDGSPCKHIYIHTVSFSSNLQRWKCFLLQRNLELQNITYSNIELLNTVCRNFVQLTRDDRRILTNMCFLFVNASIEGNLTLSKDTFLDIPTIIHSPCLYTYNRGWTWQRNNLFWQCNIYITNLKQAGVPHIEPLARSPCLTFLSLTESQTMDFCVTDVRRALNAGNYINMQFVNSSFCAGAYMHNRTLETNIAWWRCQIFVEDKRAEGVILNVDIMRASICRQFVTVNVTQDTSKRPLPLWAERLMYFVYPFVIVTGTCGNCFVIYVLLIKQKKLRPGDGLIITLAVTDFFSSILTPILFLKLLVDRAVWNWGLIACKSLHLMNSGFIHASAWTLVTIAAERTRAIVFPFKTMLSAREIFGISALIYGISFALATPKVYYQRLYRHQFGYDMCTDRYPNTEVYLAVRLLLVITVLILPFTIMIVLYTVAIFTLLKQRRLHTPGRDRSNSQVDKESQDLRAKRDMKVTMMFITVITVFFFLTSPYWFNMTTVLFLDVYNKAYYIANFRIINQMNYILPAVYVLNSCANPLIYARMHVEIKAHLLAILTRMSCNVHPIRRLSEMSCTFSSYRNRKNSYKLKGRIDELGNVQERRITMQSTDFTDLSSSPKLLIDEKSNAKMNRVSARRITYSDEERFSTSPVNNSSAPHRGTSAHEEVDQRLENYNAAFNKGFQE